MSDLVVIVPSRGRPNAVAELADAFVETCTAGTALIVAVDGDDPAPYPKSALRVQESGTMVSALNLAAAYALETLSPLAIGFMGDDHRPRTHGWDKAYVDALRELGTGIVYGDDLLQGAILPTQFAMTADIVRALGFVAPPTQKHLFVDNYLKDLGQQARCLRYLPDVIVEHVHPVAGKVGWDEGHQRVNAPAMYNHDRIAYMRFQAQGGLADAVAKVQALRSHR